MSDARRRELERRVACGEDAARVELLVVRLRAGEIDGKDLRLAAWLGDEAAREVLEWTYSGAYSKSSSANDVEVRGDSGLLFVDLDGFEHRVANWPGPKATPSDRVCAVQHWAAELRRLFGPQAIVRAMVAAARLEYGLEGDRLERAGACLDGVEKWLVEDVPLEVSGSTRTVGEHVAYNLWSYIAEGEGAGRYDELLADHAPLHLENVAISRIPSQVGLSVQRIRQQRKARARILGQARDYVYGKVVEELTAWTIGDDPVLARVRAAATMPASERKD